MIIEGKLEPHDWPRHQSPGRDHSAPFRPINRTCRVPYSATHLANSSAAKIKIFLPATLRYLIILPARLSTRFEITARTSQPFTARCNIFFSRPSRAHLRDIYRSFDEERAFLAILFIYFFFSSFVSLFFFFRMISGMLLKLRNVKRSSALWSQGSRLRISSLKAASSLRQISITHWIIKCLRTILLVRIVYGEEGK